SQRDHAWFVAYAPADDPAIAIATLVEHAAGGGGGAVAAPITKQVLQTFFRLREERAPQRYAQNCSPPDRAHRVAAAVPGPDRHLGGPGHDSQRDAPQRAAAEPVRDPPGELPRARVGGDGAGNRRRLPLTQPLRLCALRRRRRRTADGAAHR